jgi:hypothetical protein
VLVSISLLLSTLAVLFIGRLSDLQSRHAVLRTGSIFTAFSWFLRPFLLGPVGVLAGDFFYRVSKFLLAVPLVAVVYDRAGKGRVSKFLLAVPLVAVVYERAGKGPVLERTALYEMSIFFGKALTMLVGAALALALPGNFTAFFLLAALLSLLYPRLP